MSVRPNNRAPRKVVVATFFLCFLGLAVFYSVRKPTRSECITGFNLDWSQVGDTIHEVRNSLDFPNGTQRIKPLTGLSISEDGKVLYLQFKDHCYQKQRLSEDLINYWKSLGLDLPKFEPMNEAIVPSLDTIDLSGGNWRD